MAWKKKTIHLNEEMYVFYLIINTDLKIKRQNNIFMIQFVEGDNSDNHTFLRNV